MILQGELETLEPNNYSTSLITEDLALRYVPTGTKPWTLSALFLEMLHVSQMKPENH